MPKLRQIDSDDYTLLRVFATAPQRLRTVGELSSATGFSPSQTKSTLDRLERVKWLMSTMMPGGHQAWCMTDYGARQHAVEVRQRRNRAAALYQG